MQRRLLPFWLRSNSSKRGGRQPKLYIIAGCNGAGKTTASYAALPEMLQCSQFVNSDEFAKALSPFSPGEASIIASRYMLKRIRYYLEREEDFAVETTLATRSLKNIIENAQSRGYFVTVLYFWLDSPEIAIERVRDRVAAGGHNVPETIIRRRYTKGLQYFFYDYKNLADRWMLFDNTRIPFRMIAQGWKESMVVKNNRKYEEIEKYAAQLAADSENDGATDK